MRRATLFCLFAAACGPDAPPRHEVAAAPVAPPAPPSIVPEPVPAPASAPDPPPAGMPTPGTGTLAAPVPLMGSRAVSRRCDPNYDPCVPIDSDVDCAGGRGNGPSYTSGPVRVTGTDVYDLDRDGDGIGCDH